MSLTTTAAQWGAVIGDGARASCRYFLRGLAAGAVMLLLGSTAAADTSTATTATIVSSDVATPSTAAEPRPATIDDTFDRRKANRVHFYFVWKINGKTVSNAGAESRRATGFSNSTDALGSTRELPIEPVKLTLAARIDHAKLLLPLKSLTGVVEFTPQPGQAYLVKGRLEDDYSAVWLEDLSGIVASALVERYDKDDPELRPLVEQWRADILGANLQRQSDSPVARFAQVTGGESEALVRERFGPPDAINEIPGNIFAERPPRTEYVYNGLGKVLFSQQKKASLFRKQAKGLFVERVTPDLQGSSASGFESVDPETAKHLIATDNSTTLRQIAQHYYKEEVRDPAILDLLAARLARDYLTDNVMLLDALAWFCNTLGASENGRYKPLLTHVGSSAQRKKLRRYARKAADSLPASSGATFAVPGQ